MRTAARAAVAVGLLGASLLAQSPSATIDIDLAQPKAPVAPTLYGIFLEEISHAIDGGLYAELIQNRDFEEGVLPPGMKLVDKPEGGKRMELIALPEGVPKERWPMPWPWNGNCSWDPQRELVGWSLDLRSGAMGAMRVTGDHPRHPNSVRSLALSISPTQQADSSVALINSGYWGIAVQKGTRYQLAWHLRPGSFTGRVRAALESRDGKVLAQHDFGAVAQSEEWRRLATELVASDTDAQARFVLTFAGAGELQVDHVSLFPPTYKDRPNGLRRDLAEHLAKLKPSFIRYPGGCYVEGLSWESAPDWRTQVMPVEQRSGQWGYWQYRSTDGFGYHDFLQFCEDLGADAMFVAFCGMTVHPDNNMPLDRIDPVVQQTLDAIEYALGPVDSKWGAVRAKMGHPDPFPLKYVEIGNEHPPAIYGDYYRRFRAAIRAKYPQITVVMSMYWSGLNQPAIDRAGDDAIDVVDEHSYRPSGWVRSNFDYFDKYPRKPWKVYVGEYAHHHGSGDWSAAMDDSVYLMMLERNGDLVTMASYAPLFANLNQRSWGVNLIEFDAARSFVHASYHVQQVFAAHRPDVNLATAVAIAPKPDPKRPLLAGKFGLGSWNTQVEFKDLRITDADGRVVASDLLSSLAAWDVPGRGQWTAKDGVVTQSDAGLGPASLFWQQPLRTGRVTVKARRTGGSEGFLLFFGADGPERFLFCNYGAAGNQFSAIQGAAAEGIATKVGGERRGPIENGRWYELTLIVTETSAEMLLDGQRVSRIEAEALPEFFATAGYLREEGEVVVKATNYGKAPLSTTIRLANAKAVGPRGRHILIAGSGPDAENSLDRPDRIRPVETPLLDCGPSLVVTLPPHSVQVLRIPAR